MNSSPSTIDFKSVLLRVGAVLVIIGAVYYLAPRGIDFKRV
jgi:hypothetical protein